MNIQKARDIANAKSWSGDRRVNLTTAINAAKSLNAHLLHVVAEARILREMQVSDDPKRSIREKGFDKLLKELS